MSGVAILQGSIRIIDNADTLNSDVGNLNISKYLVCGTYGSIGTSLTVGTNLTVGTLLTVPSLTLSSTSVTSTIAGPLTLQSPTTSTSTGTFTTLTTTATAAANTFANPSTFNAAISGTTGSFTGALTASNFIGSSSSLTSTLQGALTVIGASSLSTLNVSGTTILTSAATINSTLTLSGLFSVTNATDATSFSSASSINTLGGLSVTKSAYVGTTLNVTGAVSLLSTLSVTGTTTHTGAVTLASTLGVTGISTFGAQLNYPSTFYSNTAQSSLSVAQGGTGILGNVWRFRTNDSTNTGARMSIGNAGMGSTYYDSQFSCYGLGVIEGTTGNTERLTFGYNGSSGPFITQIYTGTGIARPLNIYNGALFTAGGALALASTLGVTGVTTHAAAVNITSTTDLTSLTTLGGATFTKSMTLGGELNLATTSSSVTSASNPLSSTTGVIITANAVTWNDTSTAASSTATGNFYGTYLGVNTLTATNTSVTTPLASTLYIAGPPVASTNETITAAYGAYIASGNVYIGSTTASTTMNTGALVVAGGAGFSGNVVLNGILACASIQDYGALSVTGATTLGSSLTWTQIAQPTAPTSSTATTFFVNSTSGLLQSINSSSAVTTYQPLTTVGDLAVFNGTTQTRLPVTTDGYTLLCDSTATVGVSWQANTRHLVIVGNAVTVPTVKFLTKFFTGTTGSNGQVLIYPTSLGTSAGSRIFSTINFVSGYVQGNNSTTSAYGQYWCTVNSQTITVIDLRVLSGTSITTVIASVVSTPVYAPSGLSVTVKVEGISL